MFETVQAVEGTCCSWYCGIWCTDMCIASLCVWFEIESCTDEHAM